MPHNYISCWTSFLLLEVSEFIHTSSPVTYHTVSFMSYESSYKDIRPTVRPSAGRKVCICEILLLLFYPFMRVWCLSCVSNACLLVYQQVADPDAPLGGELYNIFVPLVIYDIWKCMPNFIVYTVKVLQVLLTDVRIYLLMSVKLGKQSDRAFIYDPSRLFNLLISISDTFLLHLCEYKLIFWNEFLWRLSLTARGCVFIKQSTLTKLTWCCMFHLIYLLTSVDTTVPSPPPSHLFR